MIRKEVISLLALIKTQWSFFNIDEAVIDAWFMFLKDFEGILVLSAFTSAMKEGKFLGQKENPRVDQLIGLMRSLEGPLEDPAIEFNKGNTQTKKLLLRRAWDAWGGENKMRFMPDPGYCDDPEEALRTWSFERKHFVEIYNSLKVSHLHENLRIDHEQAKKALSLITEKPLLKKIGG